MCWQCFKTARHLQVHANLHCKNRKFKCKYCNSVLTDKNALKQHDCTGNTEEADSDLKEKYMNIFNTTIFVI